MTTKQPQSSDPAARRGALPTVPTTRPTTLADHPRQPSLRVPVEAGTVVRDWPGSGSCFPAGGFWGLGLLGGGEVAEGVGVGGFGEAVCGDTEVDLGGGEVGVA